MNSEIRMAEARKKFQVQMLEAFRHPSFVIRHFAA